MKELRSAWVVFRFECRRTLTLPRLMFGLGLALFPAAIVALLQYQGAHLERDERGTIALFLLIPEVVCLMGLLLWAAPLIHAELEARTWSYLAVRPVGRGSILAGKYLAAVVWTIACAWLSLVLCQFAGPVGPRLTWVLAALVPLSCLTYGAIYVLLGVLFLQRAMVAAVAYTAILEALVAWIPAMINQFSVQYHLRCLMVKWMDLPGPQAGSVEQRLLFSDAPAAWHVVVLLGATAILLTAAAWILRRRELVKADEI